MERKEFVRQRQGSLQQRQRVVVRVSAMTKGFGTTANFSRIQGMYLNTSSSYLYFDMCSPSKSEQLIKRADAMQCVAQTTCISRTSMNSP